MTPRAGLLKILKRDKPDRVPWFGDLDYWATALIARGERTKDFKTSCEYLEWHKDLGVGFYLQGYFPFKAKYHFKENVWYTGNRRYRKLFTPRGNLQECWENITWSFSESPIERLIKSQKDLAALRYVYENTEWQADYDFAWQRRGQISEQGILLCYLPKSPFMHLVVLEAGIVAVTFTEMEAPDEFNETLTVMNTSFNQAAKIAVNSPAEVLMIPENLSSEMIGARYFQKYVRSYQERWIREIKKNKKFSMIHMDGTLSGLLRLEAATAVDVLEALTPAPVGDLDIDQWSEMTNNPNTILWGGIPGSYFTSIISDDEFDGHLKAILSVMRRIPRYVLGVADQVPPNVLEYRVRRVSELVDKYGIYE